MKIELKFGLEDILGYFDRSKASDIYRNFYVGLHFRLFPCPEDYHVWFLSGNIESAIEELCKQKTGNTIDFLRHNENFYPDAVDSPPYKEVEKIIQNMVGPVVEPYLEEHRLIGRFIRISRLVLQDVYKACTANCPDNIKEKMHSDEYAIKPEDFEAFLQWLDEHPKSNHFSLTESLKKDIKILYDRIQNLLKFYSQNKEKPISNNDLRQGVFEYLNETFQYKKF